MVTTLDKFGRVIIPKKLREQLGITPETTLHIEEDGKRIIIEPVQEAEPLIEREGVLISTGKLRADAAELLTRERKRRMHQLLSGDDS